MPHEIGSSKHIIQFVDQSHRDLRLYALAYRPSQTTMTVLARKSFVETLYTIEFGVLAESHFVFVETDRGTFTEIVACVDLGIPDASPIHLSALQNRESITKINGILHTFRYEVIEKADEKEVIRALKTRRAEKNVRQLTYLFPSNASAEKTPRTMILVTIGQAVFIDSMHTYPNEDAIVLTSSIMQRNS